MSFCDVAWELKSPLVSSVLCNILQSTNNMEQN